ncbi:MAG: DNA polymerase [Desulfobulbus propionicus]|nr:MAG: DNA polymerase [Desulfobulbus propionicus]
MSYLVLARKSRPQLFQEVVGQQPIVKTLQNALTHNRVAHALLFSGVRGTGKTTLARIMAKALNCASGPDREPCNCCISCRQITDGSSVDLHEIDGASNRGIQEIRELKEKIRFMPASSRYKIIIIDEVHMLTTEAFNALLKTLEEPPDHVYFMFATTELHKVPVTILSRCQRYELKRVERQELKQHFKKLAASEQIAIEEEALDIIAREAGGSVRDGLSLLDQLFAYGGDSVRASDVVEVLGVSHHAFIADLADALLRQDLQAVYARVAEIYDHGLDLKRLSNDLLMWFRNLILCALHLEDHDFLNLPSDDLKRLQQTAAQHNVSSLTSVFNLLLTGFEKIQFSSYPKLVLELTFFRVVQAGQVVEVADLIGRFNTLIADEEIALPALADVVPKIGTASASAQPIFPPGTGEHADEPEGKQSAQRDGSAPLPATLPPEASPAPDDSRLQGTITRESQGEQQKGLEPLKSMGPAPLNAADPPEAVASAQGRDVRRNWLDFIAYVQERVPWMGAALQHSSSASQVDDALVIQFEEAAYCTVLKNKEHIRVLHEYVKDYFQCELTVQFQISDGQGCADTGENGALIKEKRKALANDPLVLAAVDVFSGQVGDIRIGSRYRGRGQMPADDNEQGSNTENNE